MFSLAMSSARYKIVAAALENPDCPIEDLTIDPSGVDAQAETRWVSMGSYRELCAKVAAARSNPLTSVALGSLYTPKMSGLVGYLSFNQATLRGALETLAKNCELVMHGASYQLDVSPPVATFSYSVNTDEAPIAFDGELQVAAIVRAMSDHIQGFRPRQLNFMGRPAAGATELRRFFDARCVFDQPAYGVVFDAHFLDQPLRAADCQLRDTLVELMGLAGIERRESDMISTLRAGIATHLQDGDCGIEQLASTMNMTPRTLQRHLTQHGHSYTSLRDDVRRSKAVSMLEHSSLPIGEISYRLGYTEVSSFYRAFRGWTGMAPGKYRTVGRDKAAPDRALLAHERIVRAEARIA